MATPSTRSATSSVVFVDKRLGEISDWTSDGGELACADLRVDDSLDVHGVFRPDGTIGGAELVRR